mgnify:CR=1 FL=1
MINFKTQELALPVLQEKPDCPQWKPTPAAASELGISKDTLKRKMESRGGFLENKVHYILGPNRNSTITWNVDLIRDEFNRRGLQARKDG